MSKKKIYIVEDDRLVAADLAGILERSSYTVAGQSVTGEDAIEQIIRLEPDLALVDIGLEGEIDGIEAARQIREVCDIPVVYVTAYSDRETLERAKITEPFGYVLKPFGERELCATIEMAFYKHQIDRELEESRQWLQTTLQSIGDAVIATDIDGKIKFMNPVAQALTGWSQAEASGRDVTEVFRIVDEQSKVVENPLEKVLRSGKIVGLANHAVLIAKDGRKIPIDNSAAPILDVKGEIRGVVLTFRDVTERVRTEAIRRQAEDALRESNRRLEETLAELRDTQEQMVRQERLAAVGQLSAGIAHDFRTLLTTITLYAQMASHQPDLPSGLARNIEIIIDESNKAADLVQQVLDFSRRSMIQVQALDLYSLVQNIMNVLQRVIPENVRLSLEAGEQASGFTVQVDPGRIQQVLTNLATNARDAMPRGGELRFELFRVEVAANDPPPLAEMGPGTWVCLAVSDTGTGMTEEVRAHLFEPFFTTKDVDKGTGLGLAQVYGIVRQHEGYIGVETELGRGTTLRIYLPAYVADSDRASADNDRASAEESQAEEPPALPQGRGETILLVEDNEGLRKVGRSILESLGYRVLTAANGREALAVYEGAASVDLVIADVMIPEMGGKELVRELKRSDPTIKVLGITGYVVEQVARELSDAGFLSVISKPFRVETLARVIHHALSASAGRWI